MLLLLRVFVNFNSNFHFILAQFYDQSKPSLYGLAMKSNGAALPHSPSSFISHSLCVCAVTNISFLWFCWCDSVCLIAPDSTREGAEKWVWEVKHRIISLWLHYTDESAPANHEITVKALMLVRNLTLEWLFLAGKAVLGILLSWERICQWKWVCVPVFCIWIGAALLSIPFADTATRGVLLLNVEMNEFSCCFAPLELRCKSSLFTWTVLSWTNACSFPKVWLWYTSEKTIPLNRPDCMFLNILFLQF